MRVQTALKWVIVANLGGVVLIGLVVLFLAARPKAFGPETELRLVPIVRAMPAEPPANAVYTDAPSTIPDNGADLGARPWRTMPDGSVRLLD